MNKKCSYCGSRMDNKQNCTHCGAPYNKQKKEIVFTQDKKANSIKSIFGWPKKYVIREEIDFRSRKIYWIAYPYNIFNEYVSDAIWSSQSFVSPEDCEVKLSKQNKLDNFKESTVKSVGCMRWTDDEMDSSGITALIFPTIGLIIFFVVMLPLFIWR
jgi:hypothetical protein